jgi:polyferredoxin
MHEPIDYEAIQRRVLLRVQRRYRFFFHTALFFLGLPVLGTWGSPEFFLLWIGLWVFHLIWLQYQNHIERAIEQEIELERDKAMKRKRESMRLEAERHNGHFHKEKEYENYPSDWDDSEMADYDYYEEDYS